MMWYIFLQFSTPVTWFIYNDKPCSPMTEEIVESLVSGKQNLTNFKKKCFLNDYNKSVLDYYKNKSDYLLIDFASMATDGLIKQTLEDGTVHYFTASGPCKSLLNELAGKKEVINASEFLNEDVIIKTIQQLCEWIIKKGYTEEQIILVEVKNALIYCDDESVHDFKNRALLEKINLVIEKLNCTFKEIMSNCHVIQLPDNIYAPVNHKWSFAPLHYANEVYDYIYDAIDLIVKFGYSATEKISIIKEKYEKRMQYFINVLHNMHIRNEERILQLWSEKSYDSKNGWIQGKDGEMLVVEDNAVITDMKLWIQY